MSCRRFQLQHQHGARRRGRGAQAAAAGQRHGKEAVGPYGTAAARPPSARTRDISVRPRRISVRARASWGGGGGALSKRTPPGTLLYWGARAATGRMGAEVSFINEMFVCFFLLENRPPKAAVSWPTAASMANRRPPRLIAGG